MIGLEDRQEMARDIDAAQRAGARLQEACEIVGIDARTVQRWKAREGLVRGDGRPQALRPIPSHVGAGVKLSHCADGSVSHPARPSGQC